MNTKQSDLAGQFYPTDQKKLQNQVNQYLEEANPEEIKGNLKAILVPHAGIVCSGQTAAFGYKLLKNKKYQNIILLGVAHRYPFLDITVSDYKYWKTPLGKIQLSEVNKEIIDETGFEKINDAFANENSLETQLPFLQIVAKKSHLTPIVTGQVQNHQEIAQTLTNYLDKETLLVVSSDLSHYLPHETAHKTDNKTINQILNLDNKIHHDQACGTNGIKILIELAKLLNWKAKLLDYRTSGDTCGDKSRVVGYTSIAFYK